MVVIPVYVLRVVFVCFSSLVTLVGGYMLPVFLWVQLTFLSWGFPSSTFCGTGFVGT